MELSGSLSAWRRRAIGAVGVVAVLTAVSGVAAGVGSRSATDPVVLSLHGQEQPDPMVFQTDVQAIYFFVAPTHASDFEFTVSKVKEVLAKSAKPERQRQAQSWRMFKLDQPDTNGNVTYLVLLDPVVKGVTYDLFKILGDKEEGLPYDDVVQIYEKLKPGYRSASTVMLTEVKSSTMN